MRILILASSFLFLVLTSCSEKKEVALEKCADKGARLRNIESSKDLLNQYRKDYDIFINRNFETTEGFMFNRVPTKVIIPNNLSNQTKDQYAAEMWKQYKEVDTRIGNLYKKIREDGDLLDKKYTNHSLKYKLSLEYYYKLFTTCEKEYIQSPTAFINKWK